MVNSESKKNLYLHVGMPKSGSTAIQNFIAQNQAALLKKGVVYPRLTQSTPGHHALASHYRKGGISWAEYLPKEEIFSEFRRLVHEHDAHSFIISSEAFWASPYKDKLSSDLEKYNVRIIVFLRRQDEFLEAQFRQQVKVGNEIGPLDEFIETWSKAMSFKDKLFQWEEYFGRQNIIVIPYNAKAWSKGAEGKLLEVMGIPYTQEFTASVVSNISLNRASLKYILQTRNKKNMGKDDEEKLVTLLEEFSKEEKKQGKKEFIFSEGQRRMIVSKFHDDNCEIAARYLNNEQSNLFEDFVHPHESDEDFFAPLSLVETIKIERFLARNGFRANDL